MGGQRHLEVVVLKGRGTKVRVGYRMVGLKGWRQ